MLAIRRASSVAAPKYLTAGKNCFRHPGRYRFDQLTLGDELSNHNQVVLDRLVNHHLGVKRPSAHSWRVTNDFYKVLVGQDGKIRQVAHSKLLRLVTGHFSVTPNWVTGKKSAHGLSRLRME
jgi:hypothetical protein